MSDLLEEQLGGPSGWRGGREWGREGRKEESRRGRSGIALWPCGLHGGLASRCSPPPAPPREVAALESCVLRRAGPDKGARRRPLGAAVGRTDRARVAARGLGQMGLFHPPNSPRNWRLSLSPIYR